jgi:hypothetical protein
LAKVLNYLIIDPKLSSNMEDNIGHPFAPPSHLLAPAPIVSRASRSTLAALLAWHRPSPRHDQWPMGSGQWEEVKSWPGSRAGAAGPGS